jgi:enamidase
MDQPATLLLHNLGGVLTGDAAAPAASADVLAVRDGVLVAPDDPAAQAGPEAAERIDARGGWVMPGLWDGACHLYFGDHTPELSAVGALAASVGYGVTTVVAAGPAPVPGVVPTARFQRELAVLTMKSWVHDRPRGLQVHCGAVVAHQHWGAEDLQDLVASGADLLLLPVTIPADDLRRLAKTGRAAGMRVGLKLDGADTLGDALLDELLEEVRPELATPVNAVGLSGAVTDRLLRAGDCALGLVLTGNLAVAARVVRECVERGELGRPFLGSGTPDQRGVLPAGMALLLEVLGAMTGLEPAPLVAMASGNVARAFGRPGGLLGPGQPADLVVLEHGDGEFVSPWLRRPAATLVNGRPDLTREG